MALKILRSGQGTAECEIQDKIDETTSKTSNLVLYQAMFYVSCAGCKHTVLVYPLKGPSIESTLHDKKISFSFRMKAAESLLEGLRDLHACGIIHRGKLVCSPSR